MGVDVYKIIEITKEDFENYLKVQYSGKTNMFMINEVIRLSDFKLNKEKIIFIMENYAKLKEKFNLK